MGLQGKDKIESYRALSALPGRVAGRVAVLLLVVLGACQGDPASQSEAVPVGLEVGERAPELQGQLPEGETFVLRSALGSPTVLVFYRSGDCGLCRVQLEQMNTNLSAYQRAGADLVAITLDSPEMSRQALRQDAPGFPIVSVDSATFRAWGAMEPDRDAPLPATYVIDSAGLVRFRHIGRNASDRTTDAEVVAVLQEIRPT